MGNVPKTGLSIHHGDDQVQKSKDDGQVGPDE